MPDTRLRKTTNRWSPLKKLSDEEWDRRHKLSWKAANDKRSSRRKIDSEFNDHILITAKRWRNRTLKTTSGWARIQVGRIKSTSKRLGLPFDLTPAYMVSIYPEDGLCPYFKLPFINGEGKHPMSASIDKIIPSLGYVQGNVRVLSRRANTIKNDCTDPAIFRRIADDLEKHHG